ncbi:MULTISPECIES: hypothetical protein [Pseudomonas]|uniref:hypothetical protein n=1 Tax=Pseudomonas TaxID=286 RepID=UPI001269A83C|nr:hypothetical protein [Pseudomonas sp. PI1]
MIDFYSWHPYARIAFLIAPVAIGIPGMAIQVYIALYHHQKITAGFQRSPIVRGFVGNWSGSSLGARLIQVSMMGGIILWPGSHLRRGTLDPEELRSFPPAIKRLLVVSLVFVFTGVAWAAIGFSLLKLSGVK